MFGALFASITALPIHLGPGAAQDPQPRNDVELNHIGYIPIHDEQNQSRKLPTYPDINKFSSNKTSDTLIQNVPIP